MVRSLLCEFAYKDGGGTSDSDSIIYNLQLIFGNNLECVSS
jgi:hypothetical protein